MTKSPLEFGREPVKPPQPGEIKGSIQTLSARRESERETSNEVSIFKTELQRIPLLHFHVRYTPFNAVQQMANFLPPDVSDSHGHSALHYMKHHTKLGIIKLLFFEEAKVEVRDFDGFTPVHPQYGGQVTKPSTALSRSQVKKTVSFRRLAAQ